MVSLFLYIKENFPFIWRMVERANGFVFSLLFSARFGKAGKSAMSVYKLESFQIRYILYDDLPVLSEMILAQAPEELIYFEAHEFDIKSLNTMLKNPSFLMMGVFRDRQIVGYFFLRCLVNKKCFVGRMVDKKYRGQGIGKVMNEIMYHMAWDAGFRCFATVSLKNSLVMNAHKANKRMVILENLPDNHVLVEFVNKTS